MRVLGHFGVRPEAAAGHSYGELTALCAAGRIDHLHRGLRLPLGQERTLGCGEGQIHQYGGFLNRFVRNAGCAQGGFFNGVCRAEYDDFAGCGKFFQNGAEMMEILNAGREDFITDLLS